MTTTRQQAEIVANTAAPHKFGVISILVVIEILYYAFEVWKTCHPATVTAADYLHANHFDGTYTKAIYRRAYMTVRRGAQRALASPTPSDLDALTKAALDHVRLADPTVVSACMSTPCQLVPFPEDIA